MAMRGSRGIYKPIRVLFDTPVYKTAVNTCWHLQGYKTQIAMMMEFLRLQQENQIPPQITAEDMMNLLVEESKKTLREQLWEFELQEEEQEAKPLLKLIRLEPLVEQPSFSEVHHSEEPPAESPLMSEAVVPVLLRCLCCCCVRPKTTDCLC